MSGAAKREWASKARAGPETVGKTEPFERDWPGERKEGRGRETRPTGERGPTEGT